MVQNIIKDLLGINKKKKIESDIVQTAPLTEYQLKTVSNNSVVHNPPQFIVGTAQSNGMQRDHNEDSIYFFNSIISDETSQIPFGLFIIADGMGGHLHGEVASSSAVRELAGYVTRHLIPSLVGLDPEPQGESLKELMED